MSKRKFIMASASESEVSYHETFESALEECTTWHRDGICSPMVIAEVVAFVDPKRTNEVRFAKDKRKKTTIAIPYPREED